MARPIQGKTKKITRMRSEQDCGRVQSFDLVTAEDGKRMDPLPGKGALANAIACDVFERLAYHGVPLAFVRRDGDEFITRIAKMIPLEIVVRNRATGSALKRNKDLNDGDLIDPPVVEFFYKTVGGVLDGKYDLGVDDPLVVLNDAGELDLYHPGREPSGEPLHTIEPPQKQCDFFSVMLETLTKLALEVNMHLKRAWAQQGGDLWDFKIECGEIDGQVVVADVIDFDSWRVFVDGQPVSKQLYRDKAPLDAVMAALQLTARMTQGFSI